MKKIYVIILSITLFACSSKESKIQEKAQEFVLTKLKSPSTAKFADTKIVYNQHPNYIIFVAVDAQNSFGAILRQNYMVAFTMDENNKLNWDEKFGLQTCSTNPSINEIKAMSLLNGF